MDRFGSRRAARTSVPGLDAAARSYAVGSSVTLPVVRRAARSDLRPPRLGERIGGPRDDAQLAAGDPREQVRERLVDHRRAPEAVKQPEADDRPRAAHDVAAADRVGLTRGDPVRDDPAERRERVVERSNTSPPAISKTTSTGWPRFASTSRSVRPSGAPSTATSAPSSSASSRFASVEAVAITRPAPIGRPSCTASEPTPPAAAWTTTLSPGATRPHVRYRCHAVSPCSSTASAVSSSTPSGIGNVSAPGAARTRRSRRRRRGRRRARRCPRVRRRLPCRALRQWSLAR